MARGQGKGSEFERVISKQLSLWWTNGERDDIFWRSNASGARATCRAKQGKTTANSQGDLKYLDECGKPFIDTFLVECKRGYSKDLAILPILDNPKGKHPLLTFWEQAERDRETTNRPWSLLVFKRDRMEPCVMFDAKLFLHVKEFCGYSVKIAHINITSCRGNFILTQLTTFLNWLTPEVVKRWTNK